jgi:hypothetical protein
VFPVSLDRPLPLREPPSVNHRTLRGRCQMPAASNSPSQVVGSGPPSQPVNCPADSGGVCAGVAGDPAGGDGGDVGPTGALVPVEGSLVVSEEGGLPCDLIASESTTNPGNARGVTGLGRNRETARQRAGVPSRRCRACCARSVALTRDPGAVDGGDAGKLRSDCRRASDAIRAAARRRPGVGSSLNPVHGALVFGIRIVRSAQLRA